MEIRQEMRGIDYNEKQYGIGHFLGLENIYLVAVDNEREAFIDRQAILTWLNKKGLPINLATLLLNDLTSDNN